MCSIDSAELGCGIKACTAPSHETSMDSYTVIKELSDSKENTNCLYQGREVSTNKLIALRQIKVETCEIEAEARLLCRLDHPHLVKVHHCFFNIPHSIICLILDFCPGHSLRDVIRTRSSDGFGFPESELMQWFVQILLGLHYLHSCHIIHARLKPSSVLFSQHNLIKLGDPSLCRQFDRSHTPCYLSPEACQPIKLTWACDIWSVGCILHEMCTLCPTFPNWTLTTVGSFAPVPLKYNTKLGEIVKEMLNLNPERRPSAASFLCQPHVLQYLEEFIEEQETHRSLIEARRSQQTATPAIFRNRDDLYSLSWVNKPQISIDMPVEQTEISTKRSKKLIRHATLEESCLESYSRPCIKPPRSPPTRRMLKNSVQFYDIYRSGARSASPELLPRFLEDYVFEGTQSVFARSPCVSTVYLPTAHEQNNSKNESRQFLDLPSLTFTSDSKNSQRSAERSSLPVSPSLLACGSSMSISIDMWDDDADAEIDAVLSAVDDDEGSDNNNTLSPRLQESPQQPEVELQRVIDEANKVKFILSRL